MVNRVRACLSSLLIAAATTLLPAMATAQTLPCVLDKCLNGAASSSPGPSAATAPGAFDFYVLALSWSPGFCSTGGSGKAPDQCATGSDLGFVVHGLWPQNAHGFPSDCGAAARAPSRQSLDSVRGLYPDDGLARYEWRKHGTCTGQSPTDYFASVKRARAGIALPPGFQAPHEDQTWAPIDVARAFSAANPGLRPDEMAVTCRQNTLEEVRICLSKDLRGYVPCPEVARASCRSRGMDVPGVR